MSDDRDRDDIDSESVSKIDLDTVSLLIPRIKNGSVDARAELLEHVQDYMRLMAEQRLPTNLQGKVGTSDIVQQSLAKVIQGFEQFRGGTGREFYGWLNQIISNEAKRLHRDFHREKRDIKRERRLGNPYDSAAPGIVPADAQPTPRSQAIAAEQVQIFREKLSALPDDYAEVIRLRGLQRLSFREVAKRMNRSFDSVTKLWYRAVLKLQQELDDSRGRLE